ncbi:hypothetical protein [Flavobacterium album]|nr:hypothetical protein [Flavobacterium album]
MENKILKLLQGGKIFFKISKDDKPDEWDGEDVDKIVFSGYDFSETTYQFVKVTKDSETYYALLQLISEGEVSLYATIDPKPDKKRYRTTTRFMGGQGFSGMPTVSTTEMEYEPYYYVKRTDEPKLTSFIGNKKRIAEYFKNCPGIVKRLKSNEFGVKTLEQIVEYYNDFCGENSQDSDPEADKD